MNHSRIWVEEFGAFFFFIINSSNAMSTTLLRRNQLEVIVNVAGKYRGKVKDPLHNDVKPTVAVFKFQPQIFDFEYE